MTATAYGLLNPAWKAPVQEAATTALPSNTYSAGVLTATSNGALTVDGVAVSAGDRVLVAAEATGANNGLYGVTATGSGSAPYILTRTADMTTGSQVPGAAVLCEQGTANAGTMFIIASAGPFTIGTTTITWSPLTAGGGGGGQRNDWDTLGGWLMSNFDPLSECGGSFTQSVGLIYASAMLCLDGGTASKLSVIQDGVPPSSPMTGSGSAFVLTDSSGNWLAHATNSDSVLTGASGDGELDFTLSSTVTLVTGDAYYVVFLFPSTVTTLPSLAVDFNSGAVVGSVAGATPRWLVSAAGGHTTIPNPVPLSTFVQPVDSRPWIGIKA